MNKFFILILTVLNLSCLPYIEESIENFGVKGQLIGFSNKEINVQIQSSRVNRISKNIKTNSNGYFKIEIETKKYMTFTISGPIQAPPSKKALISIYFEGKKLYESFSTELNGFFELGQIKSLPDK